MCKNRKMELVVFPRSAQGKKQDNLFSFDYLSGRKTSKIARKDTKKK